MGCKNRHGLIMWNNNLHDMVGQKFKKPETIFQSTDTCDLVDNVLQWLPFDGEIVFNLLSSMWL